MVLVNYLIITYTFGAPGLLEQPADRQVGRQVGSALQDERKGWVTRNGAWRVLYIGRVVTCHQASFGHNCVKGPQIVRGDACGGYIGILSNSNTSNIITGMILVCMAQGLIGTLGRDTLNFPPHRYLPTWQSLPTLPLRILQLTIAMFTKHMVSVIGQR